MLDFFRSLRQEGRLVLMSLHPTERYHLEILQEICEQFIFISDGALSRYDSWDRFIADPGIRAYLGRNLASRDAAAAEPNGGSDG